MSKIIGVTVGTPLPKPNFKQTDPTKGDYIKNKPILSTVATSGSWGDLKDKPFGEEGWTIEWDGDITDKETVTLDGLELVRVSDNTIALSDVLGSVVSYEISYDGVETRTFCVTEDCVADGEGLMFAITHTGSDTGVPIVIICNQDLGEYGISMREGVYFANKFVHARSISSTTIKTIDETYIPDTIARASDVEANTSEINAFTPITYAEIEALFD